MTLRVSRIYLSWTVNCPQRHRRACQPVRQLFDNFFIRRLMLSEGRPRRSDVAAGCWIGSMATVLAGAVVGTASPRHRRERRRSILGELLDNVSAASNN